MTASKPEVVAYGWEHRGRHACVDPAYAEQLMSDGEQVYALIRLTDHEKLQAETERLQAERAADKARIAELEALLDDLRDSIVDNENVAHVDGDDRLVQYYRDQIARIDAALAQQGKEGEA